MLRLISICCLILLASCSSINSKEELVLEYNAFGPQVVAQDIIGTEWWQWEAHGSSRPEKYNIKVVVYKNSTLGSIKERYPVEEGSKHDFRYLMYEKAITYLNEKISENIVPSVTEELKETRQNLVNTFGETLGNQ